MQIKKLGLIALLAVILFPPIVSVSRNGQRATIGHYFALSIPAGDSYVDFRVDYARGLFYVLGIAVATLLGSSAFGTSGPSRPDPVEHRSQPSRARS